MIRTFKPADKDYIIQSHYKIDFCKEAGYENVILWTNSELTAARKLYQRNGFERTETRVRLLSNKERTEEQWARPLSFC
ncbi:hypothetical protein NST67_20240 [Bacillus sp. FSL W7-1321]